MRRALLLLPLLALLPVAGCAREVSDDGRRAGALGVAAANPSSSDLPSPAAEPLPSVPDDLEEPQDPQEEALANSWMLPDPRGTIPQMALRFMRALQRGDDLAAERELMHGARVTLSFGDMWGLHRVMSDVRRNAGLSHAGTCTRARQISPTAAVVICGRQRVVMSVGSRMPFRGVRLSDWTKHYDVYPGPHTHAYTTIDS